MYRRLISTTALATALLLMASSADAATRGRAPRKSRAKVTKKQIEDKAENIYHRTLRAVTIMPRLAVASTAIPFAAASRGYAALAKVQEWAAVRMLGGNVQQGKPNAKKVEGLLGKYRNLTEGIVDKLVDHSKAPQLNTAMKRLAKGSNGYYLGRALWKTVNHLAEKNRQLAEQADSTAGKFKAIAPNFQITNQQAE